MGVAVHEDACAGAPARGVVQSRLSKLAVDLLWDGLGSTAFALAGPSSTQAESCRQVGRFAEANMCGGISSMVGSPALVSVLSLSASAGLQAQVLCNLIVPAWSTKQSGSCAARLDGLATWLRTRCHLCQLQIHS